MKSVLISIKPKWCEKICHEIGKDETGKPIYEKCIEVRKSAPKEVPFKAYIYCTQGQPLEVLDKVGNGMVIGEIFVDKVLAVFAYNNGPGSRTAYILSGKHGGPFTNLEELSCLTDEQIDDYLHGRDGYAWHIAGLKIYDTPKELSKFYSPCPIENKDCENCIRYGKPHKWYFDEKQGLIYCTRRLSRPPQSWQYVDEVKE